MNKWHARFIALATAVADFSKDPETKVGCVIVYPDKRQFSMGYNGFPIGIADTEERLNGEGKNDLMVHAELNAILNARADLTGSTLYVTKPPCIGCSKAIVQAGILIVCCPKIDDNSSWAGLQHLGQALLLESGSRTIHFEDILSSECETKPKKIIQCRPILENSNTTHLAGEQND